MLGMVMKLTFCIPMLFMLMASPARVDRLPIAGSTVRDDKVAEIKSYRAGPSVRRFLFMAARIMAAMSFCWRLIREMSEPSPTL